MTAARGRGKPEEKAPPKKGRAVKIQSGRKKFRPLRLLVRLAILYVIGVGLLSVLFIGGRCYTRLPAPTHVTPVFADGLPGYVRDESFTYLTMPEWYIVFSADEYASSLAQRPPSAFPYLGAARQYWSFYNAVCGVTKAAYSFDTGYHAMLGVIGVSFTVESTIKSLYENSIGRLTEWLSSTDTAEDAFARRIAKEYGTFMHTAPWYEYPFGSRLVELWKETPIAAPHLLRKLERRLALTAELAVKAVYGWGIGMASGAAYAADDQRIYARVQNAPPAAFKDDRVKVIKRFDDGTIMVSLPRYAAFTRTALAMTALGVRFVDIANNDEILITVLARRGVPLEVAPATLLVARPVLTDPTMQRVAYKVPVSSLVDVSEQLARERAVIEHLYDY